MADDARIRALTEAVRIAPEDVALRRMLADALLEAGDAPGALDEYRACLRLEHDDRGTLFGMARAYQLAGKRSAALLALEDLLARTGDDAEAGVLMARILHEAGRTEEAIGAYRTAVEADPLVADLALATELGAAEPAGGAPDPLPDPLPGRRPSIGRRAGGGEDAPQDEEPADSPDEDEGIPVPISARGDEGEDDEIDRRFELERPRISFADVGGMDGLKDEIRVKIIAPMEHPELYAAYGKSAGGGILLYGPPGCGKTHLARATAGEVRASFLAIGIDDVLDMWLGRSERNLHEFFETARRHRPTVLFFDEVDAIGGNRTDLRMSAGRTVVNQFLAELDGVDQSNDGLLVLAATNAPWHLDPAFRRPGRFDRVLFVPPPDAPARAAILRILLAGKPARDVDCDAIAARTDGFSGADLKGLVDVTVEEKLRRAMENLIPEPIVTKDLLAVAKRTVPTTREWFATARNYVLYANQGGLYDAVRPWLRM